MHILVLEGNSERCRLRSTCRLYTLNEGLQGNDVQSGANRTSTSSTERPHDFCVPMRRHVAIANKGRGFGFMPQILTPNFPFFGSAANALAKSNQCVAKAVRIREGKLGSIESGAENASNRPGSAPRGSGEALGDEPPILTSTDFRGRKKRVVVRKAQLLFQHGHIVADDLERFGTHREKDGREGLAPLGTDLARVLEKTLRGHIDMLQPKGGQRSIARAGQYREGDYCLVPPLDRGTRWGESENLLDLLECCDSLLAPRGGDTSVVF